MYIDTHTHLYDEQFQLDHLQVVQNAINKGVEIMLLPNSNIETISPMLEMARTWPKNCLPMMGLHPCEVNKNFQKKLDEMKPLIIAGKYIAIGEVGLDYHWDLTFKNEQLSAFKEQINWALEFDLPLSIHTRKSIEDGISIIREKQNGKLKGVFHCFSGTIEQAEEIISLGFYLGIGGVATFKNGGLEELLKKMDLKYLLLETDSPYLAPVPFRGKRNESAYIPLIAQKIADVKEINVEEVEHQTTLNAKKLFKL